uniref:Uncharacterized protein n=1 Tax=Siphoviridae sp. ctFH16 TaxID=2827817 RepID=A0A8S5TN82_9CAUD|nr:MAG TPA: hypothetical protein [Siphoviridae sp. ctFH16]
MIKTIIQQNKTPNHRAPCFVSCNILLGGVHTITIPAFSVPS